MPNVNDGENEEKIGTCSFVDPYEYCHCYGNEAQIEIG